MPQLNPEDPFLSKLASLAAASPDLIARPSPSNMEIRLLQIRSCYQISALMRPPKGDASIPVAGSDCSEFDREDDLDVEH